MGAAWNSEGAYGTGRKGNTSGRKISIPERHLFPFLLVEEMPGVTLWSQMESGSLERWTILGLGQRECKMSLGHLPFFF